MWSCSVKQRERVASLDLLATLVLIQPSMQLFRHCEIAFDTCKTSKSIYIS